MDRVPFIPGYRFNDLTKNNHNLSSQFEWKNGYAIPKVKSIGIGKYPLDVNTFLYADTLKTKCFDPTLTYGKSKDPPKPIVQSRFNKLDGVVLTFKGYRKCIPSEMTSTSENFIIRRVTVTYFMVDDTIRVSEPAIENFGYVQGCMLKRGKIPNPHRKNRNYHWSDFNNGVELSFYGITYKLCSCDYFTKDFLTKNGIVVCANEPIPYDPYLIERKQKQMLKSDKSTMQIPADEDQKFSQFMTYDKKVLRFYAAWYDERTDTAEWRYYVLYYFLADDNIEIYKSKVMGKIEEMETSTRFLSKRKLSKDPSNVPENFPSIYLEVGSKEHQEYYHKEDLIIGNTISVMGRRFLLFDCDPFTRKYYNEFFKTDQPNPIKIEESKYIPINTCHFVIPPHVGIGDPDDTLQNCVSLTPKPQKNRNFVNFVLNISKILRYKLKMVPIIEVDKHRNFILEYCIGDNKISIAEVPMTNSGFFKGRIMAYARMRKPGFPVEENQFYGLKDLAIGAELRLRGLTFKIIEMDLWTYKYMIKNRDMFSQKAVDEAIHLFETNGFQQSKKNEILKQNFITQEIY